MTDPGQPGQPNQPYGNYNQYSQPGGGETPLPQPPYGAPPPMQKKKGGAGKVIGIVAGVLVVLLVVCGVLLAVFLKANKTNTLNAKVNDCIHTDAPLDSETAQQVKNSKIVKCDSADATYQVVGIVDNKTESQFTVDDKICQAFDAAKSAMWQGSPGKSGKVLCLAPVKK